MKIFKNTARWVLSQFKTHTICSVLVTVSTLGLATIMLLWVFGFFTVFSYLPNRSYILADTEKNEPQTLQELLHSDTPDIDSLLRNPAIAEELLTASQLTDVVDSRLALNNLRILDGQLSERLDNSLETIQSIDLPLASSEEKLILSGRISSVSALGLPENSLENKAVVMPFILDTGKTQATQIPLANPQYTVSSSAVSVQQALAAQTGILTNLQTVIQSLLKPPSDTGSVEIPSTVNMKGVWQNPGEILLHMTPSGDWVPEGGFKLYREIDGRRELVKEGVASPVKGQSGDIELEGWEVDDKNEYEKHKNENFIQKLYKQAELTQAKLEEMGMANAEEFRSTVYRTDTLESKPRVGGGVDFERMRDMRLTIPADIGQKIPETDILLGNPIYVQNKFQNNALINASIRSSIWQKFSLIQANPINGLSLLEGRPGFQIAYEIFTARQQLISLSFVDDEYAEEAGFLFCDNLSGVELKDDADIAYYVETSGGILIGRVFLTNGKTNDLTKPQGLKGYGIDGKVPLRWDQAESDEERGIMSGYIIERKLDGEKNFVRINKEPVVVSYILDESDVYFESPTFFEDEVKDGRIAQYRIRSIDVFGRMSEYSDVIEFKVEKVTPPNAPSVSPATLSVPVKKTSKKSAAEPATTEMAPVIDHSVSINHSIEANKKKLGIVLPIFTDSSGTVRFTIYRAAALGAEGFGPPEVLSNIKYDNPSPPVDPESGEPIDNNTLSAVQSSQNGSGISQSLQSAPSADQLVQQNGRLTWQGKSVVSSNRINGAKQIILGAEISGYPDLTYFDADVKEGYTYKYWVSAWDSWNNESAWSQSVTMGVPTKAEPKIPNALDIRMLARELIDLSGLPPGILEDPFVSYEDLETAAGHPMRQYEDGIDTETVKTADRAGISIGSFTVASSPSSFPAIISTHYDNLPEEKYIHMFLAVRGEDVLPDGTARLKWPAYSGEGLGGYMIYQPLFTPGSFSEMQKMSRNELVQMGQWQLINDNNTAVTQNQLVVGGLDRSSGSISLFLICLKPSSSAADYIQNMNFTLTGPNPSGMTRAEIAAVYNPFGESPASGYVDIAWEAPKDPQIKFYRIYRSEVSKQVFQQESDAEDPDWTLIGDHITTAHYTDPVEQSFAHYYYYKVTSVSPWGVESTVGTIQRFRVPSTKPPQTPNLLLPLSRKDGVQVNFAAVNHCDRYEIYRTEIPRPTAAQLADFMSADPDLFKVLFNTPYNKDAFLTGILTDSINPLQWKEFIGSQSVLPQYQGTPSAPYSADFLLYSPDDNGAVTLMQNPAVTQISPAMAISQEAPIMAFQKFKTVTQLDSSSLANSIAGLGDANGLRAYQSILAEFGPLALADYSDLSRKMMEMVSWTKLGEVPAAEQEVDPTGLLKPLSFIDETAEYGITYLYTVQAWNDDNLGSGRPEPVEATPRRNGPFDPIGGLTGKIVDIYPNLTWNAPTMKNLTEEQCREDTVGYIVYRSDKKDGTYYQASPLLFEREWIDKNSDMYAFNWYQVKVLDTGGYLSEFSEPFLVHGAFVPDLVTIIPDSVQKMLPPEIALSGTNFSIKQGTVFQTAYSLTGTEPIGVTVSTKNEKGATASGFSINTVARAVNVSSSLPAGSYTVTVTAKNSVGESSATFLLKVTPSEPVITPPTLSTPRKSFNVKEGTGFETTYTLTGTEPITVTVAAKNAKGAAVSSFSVNSAMRTINAPGNLAVGTYNVVVKAKNSAGESSITFTLEVTAEKPDVTPPPSTSPSPTPPAVTPPVLTLEGSRFIIKPGSSFQTKYTLTGSEPITVTVKGAGPDGGTIGGLSVNTSRYTIYAGPDISPGTYNVTVTAKNSAGESSKSFYLTVEAVPVLTPPKLEVRRDDYKFTMYNTVYSSQQLSASGSEPFSWSLEPISRLIPVPAGVSIDNTGLLSINKGIPVGTYSFNVRVENGAGFDTKTVTLEVITLYFPRMSSLSLDYESKVMLPDSTSTQTVATLAMTPLTIAPSAMASHTATSSVTTPQATMPQTIPPESDLYQNVQMRCMSFFLTDIQLSRPLGSAGLVTGYSGTAKLNIGNVPVPVSIVGAYIDKAGSNAGQDKMTKGTVYIKEPFEIEEIGLTLVSLNISPSENKAEVSGYIKNPQSDLNVLGDRYAFKFKDAELQAGGNIIMRRGVPNIRYEQFTIHGIKELWINTSGVSDLFTLVGSTVDMKCHLETLDNESLRLKPFSLSFDRQRKMNADLSADTEQALRLIAPGCAALRVEDAFLAIRNGVAQSNSYLLGKLVLPFEEAGIQGPGVPGTYVGGHPAENELDALVKALDASALQNIPGLSGAMQKALIKYGERVQQNGLLVVPDDFDLQDQCSSVSIEVHNWSGAGFTIESAEMTPVNMTNRNLNIEEQRSQGIVISPTAVSVDLDRESFIPKANAKAYEKIMTPKETEKPFWIGLVMHGGTVALPPDFVHKDEDAGGGAITFALAKGEMIYDLNGFNYQTYLYNKEGVPADFGDALGGFHDVWVYDCLLDLYANRVNLEINAEVAIDLFRDKRVDAKLYTNKEDNADGKKGQFLCSVAPTTIEDAPATGVDITIGGGWFKEEGMYISGSMVMQIDEIQTGSEPMPFTNMIVPSDIKNSGAMSKANRRYAAVELDRPINIDFQGFTMEIRALDMSYKEHPSKNVNNSDIWLTLHGATLLAENVPLSSDTKDTVVVNCPISPHDPNPSVFYEQSQSVLKANFDGCIEVSGILVPKAVQPGEDGLVEFDTDELGLSFLSQLDVLPVKTSARFGYDSHKDRCYFVVGIATGEAVQIPFGVGRMKDFAGLISYNMIAERDGQRRLQIPSYKGMEEFIKRQEVNREGGTSFVAGVSTTLVISELCEIRNLYFGFESGPIVDAGGELFLPLKVDSMVTNSSPYTPVGSVVILYSHPERYFSFNVTVDLKVAMAQVGGSIGFEYSPRLFGVYIGYPEMLGGRIGISHIKMGVGYIAENDVQRLIRIRAEYGYNIDVDISIVYLRAFLYAGIDGTYAFGGEDADKIILELYLKGGIEGGIRALGRRYNIISFYLDANGKMTASYPYTYWLIEASCKVSYSLDVWVHSFEGSVTAKFDTRVGL